MKKLFAFLLAAVMLLSLAACGNKAPSGSGDAPGTEAPAAPAQGGAQTESFENKIVLSLDKTHYDQAERIEVTMDLAAVDQDKAVIAIVSAGLPHGGLAPAEEDAEEYRWLADFSEIPFYLWAPEKDGVFDVRVYAGGDAEELAYVSFATGSAALPSGVGAPVTGSGNGGQGSVLTEGGDCTQRQMEDAIVSYLSGLSGLSALTLGGGSRIEYTKAGDALNDFDFWTVYEPALDNAAMFEAMNSQLSAAGFTYEKDMVGRHVWYVDDGGEHKGILFWPDDDEYPDGYYILMMTYATDK